MLENSVVKSTTAGVTSAKPTYFVLERYMPAYRAEWMPGSPCKASTQMPESSASAGRLEHLLA